MREVMGAEMLPLASLWAAGLPGILGLYKTLRQAWLSWAENLFFLAKGLMSCAPASPPPRGSRETCLHCQSPN